MVNEGEKRKEFSAKSAIYGALVTLALIFVIFCVYMVAMIIKFVVIVLGPVIFSIVTAGAILVITLGAIQFIKSRKTRGKKEHEDT